jgi:uncharacterized membrane protein
MFKILESYTTPFTTGLFLVSLISDLALFFHIGGHAFHGMYEWLSLVLIIPLILHLWRNWGMFKTYFKRFSMALALMVSLAAAVAFAVPSMMEGGHSGSPRRVLFKAFENGSVAQVAPLGRTTESLTAALKKAGYTVTSPGTCVAS